MAREAIKVAACWQDTNRYTSVQCLVSATNRIARPNDIGMARSASPEERRSKTLPGTLLRRMQRLEGCQPRRSLDTLRERLARIDARRSIRGLSVAAVPRTGRR